MAEKIAGPTPRRGGNGARAEDRFGQQIAPQNTHSPNSAQAHRQRASADDGLDDWWWFQRRPWARHRLRFKTVWDYHPDDQPVDPRLEDGVLLVTRMAGGFHFSHLKLSVGTA